MHFLLSSCPTGGQGNCVLKLSGGFGDEERNIEALVQMKVGFEMLFEACEGILGSLSQPMGSWGVFF